MTKEVTEGKMKGKRGPGRKRIGMIDELVENEWHGDLKRRAKNRHECSLAARDLPCDRALLH